MHTERTAEFFNKIAKGFFPEYLGIEILNMSEAEISARFFIKKEFLAPNGYLHAGSVVTLADTLAGFACVACMPQEAKSFTTVELKSNFLGTAREGEVIAIAKAEHLGKTTHVWDVVLTHKDTGKKMALFRCTQMILY